MSRKTFPYDEESVRHATGTLNAVLVGAAGLMALIVYQLEPVDVNIGLLYLTLLAAAGWVLRLLLALTEFGKFIERFSDGTVATSWIFLNRRFIRRELGRVKRSFLKQIPSRHYVLMVETEKRELVQLEQHATLKEAQRRFDEFQEFMR